MNPKKALLFSGPLLGGALVLFGIAFRARSEGAPAPAPKKPPAPVTRNDRSILAAPPPPAAPPPAPELTVALAMDEARLRTTYRNYRTALATGNRVQADALVPVLRRDRLAALRLAQQDLAQARQELDRSVAEVAVNALRR